LKVLPIHPYPEEELLTRFLGQIGASTDTPCLIVMIAADADYLRLCHSIIDPNAEYDPGFTRVLKRICRDHGWRLGRLKEKLTPAAIALGIAPFPHTFFDYYRILGVRPQANGQEIKTAYRRKAIQCHPDANANLSGGSRQFAELNEAYRTLRDPLRRQHYDLNRQRQFRWREPPTAAFKADSRPRILLWYLIGLLFIFLFLFLVLDAIVIQK
jgi:DnaJ-domain-containing protein 1